MIVERERRDLVAKLAVRDRGERALMALQRKRILLLARHLPALRHFLGRDAHAVSDADVLVGEDGRIDRDLVAHHRHHAHASVPPASITSASPRRMRSAASATACKPDEQKRLTVMPGTVSGKPGEQHADARDVHALLGLRHRAADDHVADARRVDAGRAS